MNHYSIVVSVLLASALPSQACSADPVAHFSGERRLNNLVSELLDASAIASPGASFTFTGSAGGWVFIASTFSGTGTAKIIVGAPPREDVVINHTSGGEKRAEAVRRVAGGQHTLRVECTGDLRVDKLVVKAIPELIHCGLGFDSAIKSYGKYDLEFLKKDILPNVTTVIVPHNIALPAAVIDDWHRQGKRFVAEVGIDGKGKTPEDHFKHWTSYLDKAPFLDGIIVNEFIINNPVPRPNGVVSPERQARMDQEQARHRVHEEAIKKLRADPRYKDKMYYAYIGGSGKKLNQEMIGPTFVKTLIDADCRIALERYLHEMSSEQGSKNALDLFVDGMSDWQTREPAVMPKMVVTFGLFSMPPGGINKQPNVDYHVWMDQQMNAVANQPVFAGLGGLNWWTSLQADEETVRFVGKLYRHYAIDGKKDLLTRDPLFLTHIQNADFEKGLEGWTLKPAGPDTIQAKSFPRYGRIEGRYMGLGRPADPEHIGDTFLWMKRRDKAPNVFSQTIKNLQPGRLYSLKMFTCDYQDLVSPKAKKLEEATAFIGKIDLDGVDVDARRSFAEAYASNPEPRIPVWITYHWKVFRAKGPTATITVSDWPEGKQPAVFGQEQTFNFLEIQPYHE